MSESEATETGPVEDAGLDDWNSELEEEVVAEGIGSLVVYSRDWTVETILSQIEKNNIDLNPAFQRRNAWNDLKRSKLIESLIIGVPVPEIVLAEDQKKKRSFIIIDGKQRLLAIAGFADPSKYPIWNAAKLQGLNTRKDLNGKSYEDMTAVEPETAELRQLRNSDIRCTVISNYDSIQVLYDIFYRLNSGSVPLSSQELRQVLNRGDFANYLIRETDRPLPIHDVLNLSGPDNRLRDAEILLRFIAFSLFGSEYTGNLTPFLDSKMALINYEWASRKQEVQTLVSGFNSATALLLEIMPSKKVGRKYTSRGWESRFNRALFEVQVYYIVRVPYSLVRDKSADFVARFQSLCLEDREFIDSIETSTKNITKYHSRFRIFQNLVNEVFGTNVNSIPVPLKN